MVTLREISCPVITTWSPAARFTITCRLEVAKNIGVVANVTMSTTVSVTTSLQTLTFTESRTYTETSTWTIVNGTSTLGPSTADRTTSPNPSVASSAAPTLGTDTPPGEPIGGMTCDVTMLTTTLKLNVQSRLHKNREDRLQHRRRSGGTSCACMVS